MKTKIHAAGVEIVGPGKGFSVCGIYRLDLTRNLSVVTCAHCLRKLPKIDAEAKSVSDRYALPQRH